METSLHHEIFIEGSALHRDVREWREQWREDLHGRDGMTAEKTGRHSSACSKRLSSPLHAYYPFLFHTCFPGIPIETVRELARADRLYTEHLLLYDRILDRQKPVDTTGLFLAQMEHMQSLKRLYLLFPAGHPFWDYFYDCYFETWKSVRKERLCHSFRIETFPLTRFCALAKGKTALLRPFSMALAFLANRREEIHRLSASLDRHHIALVLIDDLEDWRQDFRSCNFTYLLTRLIQREGLTDRILSGQTVSPERIGRLLYTSGSMEKQLRRAEFFLRKSNEAVGSLPLPSWKDFNDGFRNRCRALRHDLAEIRRREEGRTRIRESLKGGSETADGRSPSDAAMSRMRSGVRFLVRSHAREGIFRLSRSPHAYMCPLTCVAPSRSVTTLIIRSLQPVLALDSALSPLLRAASDWVLDAHETKFHPGLPAGLERAFAPIPSDPHELSLLDRSFAPAYGPMPDGLFWSNFLDTCAQTGFQPPRLHAFVSECLVRGDLTAWGFGVSFGPVASPWTRYACRPLLPLLLFCRALDDDLPGSALPGYLLEPYRTTGSWNNTTETALALLCLLLAAYDGPELAPAVDKLSESQESNGSWAPNAIYRERNDYYGSRELTTAWCLEALYRYHSRVARAS